MPNIYEQMEYQPYGETYQPFTGGLTGVQEQGLREMISGKLSPAQMQQLQKAYGVASQRVLGQGADIGMTTGGIGSLQQKLLGDYTMGMGTLGAQQRQAGLQMAQPFTEFQAGQQAMPYQYGLQEHQMGEQYRVGSLGQRLEDRRQLMAMFGGIAGGIGGGFAGGAGAAWGASKFLTPKVG